MFSPRLLSYWWWTFHPDPPIQRRWCFGKSICVPLFKLWSADEVIFKNPRSMFVDENSQVRLKIVSSFQFLYVFLLQILTRIVLFHSHFTYVQVFGDWSIMLQSMVWVKWNGWASIPLKQSLMSTYGVLFELRRHFYRSSAGVKVRFLLR